MHYVDFGETTGEDGTPNYRRIGYDLDGMCSRQGQPARCSPPSLPTDGHDDGPDGRDNAAGAFFHFLAQIGGESLSTRITNQARTGFISTIIRVREYDHAGADDQVEVSWYSGRLLAATPQTPHQDASSPGRAWNPNDAWIVFDDWLESFSVGEPGSSGDEYAGKYHDARAYVTDDGILVARFAEALTAAGIFQNAVLTGELVRTEAAWELRNATFAGRIGADESLRSIAQDDIGGPPLCTDQAGYQALKGFLCSHPDMHSSGGDAPGFLPCDSLSAAWNFGAEQIVIAGSEARKRPVSACPGDTSPASDSCALASGQWPP